MPSATEFAAGWKDRWAKGSGAALMIWTHHLVRPS